MDILILAECDVEYHPIIMFKKFNHAYCPFKSL